MQTTLYTVHQLTRKQPNFNKVAAEHNLELIDEDRGAPENTGLDFTASHPVVRTNPVTGWKSLFGTGHQVHAGWIDNVTETESEVIKAYCTYYLSVIIKPLLTRAHSPETHRGKP
jgi:hypothetical protein